MYRVFTVAAERFKPRGVIARSCLFRSSSHNIGPCTGRADSMGKAVPFHRSVRVSHPFEDSDVSTTDSMGKSRFHSRGGKKTHRRVLCCLLGNATISSASKGRGDFIRGRTGFDGLCPLQRRSWYLYDSYHRLRPVFVLVPFRLAVVLVFSCVF